MEIRGRSEEHSLLSVEDLMAWQDAWVAIWHENQVHAENITEQDYLSIGGGPALGNVMASEHLINIKLWHEEDEARRPDVDDGVIAATKRRIDALNQRRNDLIERIDEELSALLDPTLASREDVPLHSETPGSIADRLSILALKIYHMKEEADREDAAAEHRESCRERLRVLELQREDLAGCLSEFFDELVAGRKRFRRYRQFKMYNDPEMNPFLRRAAARAEKGEEP